MSYYKVVKVPGFTISYDTKESYERYRGNEECSKCKRYSKSLDCCEVGLFPAKEGNCGQRR